MYLSGDHWEELSLDFSPVVVLSDFPVYLLILTCKYNFFF